MSTINRTVIAQLVTGAWIMGRLETEDGFVDEAVQKGLTEDGGLVIMTPVEIVMQPGRDGKAQLMLPNYGFPVLQFDLTKDVPRFFPAHAFAQYPEEAPQMYADYYTQNTSSIQIAPAGALATKPGHLRPVK